MLQSSSWLGVHFPLTLLGWCRNSLHLLDPNEQQFLQDSLIKGKSCKNKTKMRDSLGASVSCFLPEQTSVQACTRITGCKQTCTWSSVQFFFYRCRGDFHWYFFFQQHKFSISELLSFSGIKVAWRKKDFKKQNGTIFLLSYHKELNVAVLINF